MNDIYMAFTSLNTFQKLITSKLRTVPTAPYNPIDPLQGITPTFWIRPKVVPTSTAKRG
jgi:hypothetical protein